jgi:uncharacterized protein YjbJ (UPF0337 family)
MTDPESPERTAGGLLGDVVGKAKSAVGSLFGNEDLQREGNLQQAQVEAEADAERAGQVAELQNQEALVVEQRAAAAAERDRLRGELEAEATTQRLEEDKVRRARQVAADAAAKQADIQERAQRQERVAETVEAAALRRRAEQAAEAARLEQAAAAAERSADIIDPEEHNAGS